MRRRLRWCVVGGIVMLAGFAARHSLVFAQSQASGTRAVKRKVMPPYPEIAKRMNLIGKVRFEVVIAADGSVTETHCIGGSPVLVQAAETAIKEWKFVPGPAQTRQNIELEFTGADNH